MGLQFESLTSLYHPTMNIITVFNSGVFKAARPALNIFRSSLYRSSSTSTPSETGSCSTKKDKLNRAKTPIGKLDELEKGPLQPRPDATNPNTGEVGGPKGPEPTRYGDW